MAIPGIGSFPCLFRNAAYALMNFCACTNQSNQHHSVVRSHCDSLAPALLIAPSRVPSRLRFRNVWLPTSTSRTDTPPVIIAVVWKFLEGKRSLLLSWLIFAKSFE